MDLYICLEGHCTFLTQQKYINFIISGRYAVFLMTIERFLFSISKKILNSFLKGKFGYNKRCYNQKSNVAAYASVKLSDAKCFVVILNCEINTI